MSTARSRQALRPAEGPQTSELSRDLADLTALDLDQLRLRWRNAFGSAPARLPRHLLVRVFAYMLQAQAHGDLDRETVRLLDRLRRDGQAGEAGARVPPPARRALKPGTLLVREHDGVLHRVMVLDDGFAWQGTTYASLSTIALAITGTRWNGPRFFGLRERTPEASGVARKSSLSIGASSNGPGARP